MSFTPIIITLDKPLQHGNEEIRELIFPRMMQGGDLRGDINVGVPTYDNCRTVASRITGVPESVLKTMEWPDFLEVVDTVMVFFNTSRRTGGTE